MSTMESDGVQIEPVGRWGREEALRFLVAGARDSASVRIRVEGLRALLNERNGCAALWRARRLRRCLAAAMVVESPGKMGMLLHSPSHAPGVEPGALVRVGRAAAQAALADGLTYVQALCDVGSADSGVLEAAGLRCLADLLYLRLDLVDAGKIDAWSPPDEDPGSGLSWRAYGDYTEDELGRVIRATYEGSQDCPELVGVRTMGDVIDAHKAGGRFRPSCWWILQRDRRPAGCVLLNDAVSEGCLEVTYLGVVPAFRGQGLGRRLITRAVESARELGKGGLTLASDSRNLFALRLYEDAGFCQIAHRSVYFLTQNDAKPARSGGVC
jgi:GNAT superfamily N-acetyltransferase